MRIIAFPANAASPEQMAAFRKMWRERAPDDVVISVDGVQVFDLDQSASRPCVLFGAKLSAAGPGSWRARFGDLTAYGETPEAAMDAFDEAFKGADVAVEDNPAAMHRASARVQSLGCGVHITESGAARHGTAYALAVDITVKLSPEYARVVTAPLPDSLLEDGVILKTLSGPKRYTEAAKWLTELHTHLGRH